MEELKQKILEEGVILPGNIVKVDSFLNHQIDVEFMDKIGLAIYNLFKDMGVNKVLTIETSGVPIAMAAAKYFKCRVVFAKKGKTKNLSDNFYKAEVMSYTHGQTYDIVIAKEYLNDRDKVILVDDFLANGSAMEGLIKIVKEAGAKLIGCSAVIEKGFQPGGQALRDKGINLKSLVIIDKIDDKTNNIEFREE